MLHGMDRKHSSSIVACIPFRGNEFAQLLLSNGYTRHISYRDTSIVAWGHYLATAISLAPRFLLWVNTSTIPICGLFTDSPTLQRYRLTTLRPMACFQKRIKCSVRGTSEHREFQSLPVASRQTTDGLNYNEAHPRHMRLINSRSSKFGLLGSDAVWSGRYLAMFRSAVRPHKLYCFADLIWHTYQNFFIQYCHVSGALWRMITGSRSDDWIYWCFLTITVNYNHLTQLIVGDCLRLVPFPSWTASVFPSTVAS
jgi:hypothetical protein